MSRRNEIQELIATYNRRLQILLQQKATQGISVEPKIIIQIEDIEAEIEKLQLKLKETEPNLVITYEAEDEPFRGIAVDAGYRTASFYRLSIVNTGLVPAEDCEGLLIAVEPIKVPSGGRKLGRPVVLKWAHEDDYFPITIEPEESRKLDIFYIFEDDPSSIHFYFELPRIPAGLSRTFPFGRYQITIRIESKNADSVKSSFVLDTDGKSMNANIEGHG